MSHAATPSLFPSTGLGKHRWSVLGTPGSPKVQRPASIAGLPGSNAWVCVGPPLFCSGPSLGSATVSPPPATVQSTLPIKLLPVDVIVPPHSVPKFPARIVLKKFNGFPTLEIPPPAPLPAWFWVIVTLRKFAFML